MSVPRNVVVILLGWAAVASPTRAAAQTSTASTEFVYLAHGETYTFKPRV